MCHKCGLRGQADAVPGSRCPNDGLALVPEEEHKKAPRDSILGRVIGGKYPVVGVIGSGGMGSVYRALQEPVGREVALKVIRNLGDEATEEASETLRARFFREAKVVAKLANASAVTLYDYGAEEDGVLYMVLELVKGRRLSDAIREEGVLSPVRAVDIACKVLNALSEAHALGLVHRDLKPDNIMLVIGPWGEEQAKVLDFGIAKVRTKEKETLETGTGLLLGTPLYMPPEQAMARGAETRSDLYSLGVVLFEMLCGHPPFTAATVFEVLLAHREKPVPPLPPECQVPPALEAAIARAMAKEPEQRFADAADMAQALAEAVPLNAPGTESLRPGPGSPVAAVALRTPLPLGARQSGPGLLSAKTATPLPHGSKRSGAVSASAALRARQSVAGVPPPPQVDPDLASTHTPLPAEKVPQGPDADTAGTMMKSTPAAAPVFRRSSPPKPAPHPAAEPRLSTAERAVVKGSGGRMMLFGVLGLLALGLGGGTSWYLFGRPAAVAKVPDPDPIAKLVEKPPDKLPDKVAEPVKVPDPVVAEAGPDASVPTKVAAKDPDDADADPKKNPKNPKTVASHGPKTPKPKPDRTDKPDSAPTPNPKKDGTHKVDDHGYQVPEF